MRPTQESLFPLIEKYASQYVICLLSKTKKNLQKAILYSIYGVFVIILFAYTASLGYGNGFDNGPLIFRALGIVVFIAGIFIIGEFFESLKLYRFYRTRHSIENDWLKNKRPAIVCLNCYEKDCPEIDMSFDLEAEENSYTAVYLIEYFYKRHMVRASFNRV